MLTEENALDLLLAAEEVVRPYLGTDVESFVRDLAITNQMMYDERRDGWRYNSYQALLLDLGTPTMAPLALPDGYEPMELQQCYLNCYTMALCYPELTYVEGLACGRYFPMGHAWLEDMNGRIIDPTWSNLLEHIDRAYYLGVRFDTEYLVRHAMQTEWISFFQTDDLGDLIRLGFVMEDGTAIDQGEA